MTINKAQGQTLQFLSVYVKSTAFAHGQLYVAVSRVGSFAKILIYLDADDDRQGLLSNQDGHSCFVKSRLCYSMLAPEIRSSSSHDLFVCPCVCVPVRLSVRVCVCLVRLSVRASRHDLKCQLLHVQHA